MKMESNKAFHPYGAQGAPRVNADVRQITKLNTNQDQENNMNQEVQDIVVDNKKSNS